VVLFSLAFCLGCVHDFGWGHLGVRCQFSMFFLRSCCSVWRVFPWLFLCNQISALHVGVFNGCEKLQIICFNNNQINEDIFKGCKQLFSIKFNNNQKIALPDGIFNGCKQLEMMAFDNNQISVLPEGIFKEC